MKRIGNVYKNICNLSNIISVYNEICSKTRNKNRVAKYKEFKCIYIARVYNTLINKNYIPGPYHKFIIHEPKERLIASQSMHDKMINHLVARYILYPAILPSLLDINVASRKDLGTGAGLKYFKKFNTICKSKYETYYILKCDISKFFHSIDIPILKAKILRKIKDTDAIKIIFDIIDTEESGLNIGSMTSQVLAIFYLNDMDHFIKENLKIKYYLRYQDDFVLFHKSKTYLQYCLKEIKKFLADEKLSLNKKTRIYKSTDSFIFLGRNKKGNYAKYRLVNRKLKKRKQLYDKNKISLNSLACSLINYENLCKKDIKMFHITKLTDST